MSLTDTFIERAKKSPKRIVLPEGDDARVLEAAGRLAAEKIVRPVVLAAPGTSVPAGVELVDPSNEAKIEQYAALYASQRGVKEGIARRLVKKSLMFGAMMVSAGDADGMVAGVAHPTATVISTAGLAIGYAEGVSSASSFFVMVLPGPPERVLIFADCAVAVEPNAQELAGIAIASASNAKKLLGMEPRVAMLSFSTKGSGAHASVDKVVEATRIAKELAPDLAIDGELQADSALVESVAKKKCPDSTVAGAANVLVFPDLNSGNIGYKLVQRLAGAAAIGPVMQGFRRPVNDLSRGASADDIVAVSAIAALQAD